MPTMPEVLRSLRISKSLTQSEVAEKLGLTTNAYQSYERGTSEPNCKSLRTLADYYGVSVDYLIGRTNERYSENTVIEQYMTLPENVQVALLELIQKMADTNESTRKSQSIKEAIMGIFSLLIDQIISEKTTASNTDESEENQSEFAEAEKPAE